MMDNIRVCERNVRKYMYSTVLSQYMYCTSPIHRSTSMEYTDNRRLNKQCIEARKLMTFIAASIESCKLI